MSFAQSGNWQVDKLAKDYAKLSYQRVISDAKGILRRDSSLDEEQKKEVLSKLAYSLYNINDYKQAEEYFSTLASLVRGSTESGNDILEKYAKVLAGNGKYEQSSNVWSEYGAKSPNTRADDFKALQSNIQALKRNSSSYQTYYLPINTNNADFSPTKYNDGLVFVSARAKNSPIKRVFAWDYSPFLDLFFIDNEKQLETEDGSMGAGLSSSDLDEVALDNLTTDSYSANDGPTLSFKTAMGFQTKPQLASDEFSGKLNSSYHEGPCQFFENGERVIFTRNGIKNLSYESDDGLNRVHLYLAKKTTRGWANLEGFPFNDGNYSTGHPAFMPGEKILFFVSDMPGGYGGTDIYYSKLENEQWQTPQNAGSDINTDGNEMFPFIDESSILYFSSDGHPGLGGLDLFTITLDENGNVASGLHNLGEPLNSSSDDFGILSDKDFTKGYFSSNRKRGGSDDDIYRFTRTGDKLGCKDALLSVITDEKPIADLEFFYYELSDKDNVKKGKTDAKGQMALCLNAESIYYFEFADESYVTNQKYIDTKGISDYRVNPIDIVLEKTQDANILRPQVLVMGREKDLSRIDKYRGVIFLGDMEKPVEGVRVRFVNKCTGRASEVVTSRDGKYSFDRDPACDYEFIAIKSGFATNYEFVPMEDKRVIRGNPSVSSNSSSRGSGSNSSSSSSSSSSRSGSGTVGSSLGKSGSGSSSSSDVSKRSSNSFFDPRIFKVGDFVKLDNIYYETKDFSLASAAQKDLDQLILVMESYSDMVIEIFSHTDSRGTLKSNLLLSQKRADDVKAYLVRKGIASSRIKAVGMGEKYPVNKCKDGVQCTEAEYRRNRRTEFKILQIERI
ncbi:hypothetical protein DJ013_08040 [Arcticibacterium luteifluviistationis]|uniref:OmpA-like domain-containing protein n=2 Tax=Arcticibacterium luteifluviistationis TaxID=1784714 RepID=A0A2Z4GA94_9BACT|nr:hypothetical protein DJ013_08040 [Arcticibacterium luteifluviistationis]